MATLACGKVHGPTRMRDDMAAATPGQADVQVSGNAPTCDVGPQPNEVLETQEELALVTQDNKPAV